MRQTVDIERGVIMVHDDPAPDPAMLFRGPRPPLWHPSRWDWSRTEVSLGLCQRYAKLTPAQRRVHDVEALGTSPGLLRLMPAATRSAHADPQFIAMAQGLRAALDGSR